MNFPFTCSNIITAHSYGVYISQLIRCSIACGWYHDFRDRASLLTKKLLNQVFLVVKLKSSLRKVYCRRHYGLFSSYGIFVSQMTTWYVPFSSSQPPPLSHSWIVTEFVTRVTLRVPLMKQELLTLPEHTSSPLPVFVEFVMLNFSFSV